MKLFLCLVLLFTIGACASHQNPPVTTTPVVAEPAPTAAKEIAFGGYCGNGLCHKKLVKGDPKYNVEYKGKVYHFSSEAAKANFTKDMDKNIQLATTHFETTGTDKPR